jgi:hypothetical protein
LLPLRAVYPHEKRAIVIEKQTLWSKVYLELGAGKGKTGNMNTAGNGLLNFGHKHWGGIKRPILNFTPRGKV